jgi:hypothetical protein
MVAEGAKEARATKLRIGKHDLMKEGLVEIQVEGGRFQAKGLMLLSITYHL